MKELITKFLRFAVVGTSGTVIDFAVTGFLMTMFGMGHYLSQSISDVADEGHFNTIFVILVINAIGFVVAATSNYFFNRVWTWHSKNPDIRQEYSKFFAVSLIGLGINLGVIYLMEIFFGFDFVFMGYFISRFWVSKTIATVVVMVWNFLANNFYTFAAKASRN
ncbi:MAG: GtrA family protein [Mucinivorans sp.]